MKVGDVIKALGRVITFHPGLSRLIGSVKATIFFEQLMYWSDKGHDAEGWIYKTREEWEDETSLTRREQETVRALLIRQGLMEEQLRGFPAQLYFRPVIQRLEDLWNNPQLGANRPTSMAETAQHDGTKPPNSSTINPPIPQEIPVVSPMRETYIDYSKNTSTVEKPSTGAQEDDLPPTPHEHLIPDGISRKGELKIRQRCQEFCGAEVGVMDDKCPNPKCGYPVVWPNSKHRTTQAERRGADLEARRQRAEKAAKVQNTAAGYVLNLARASDPTGRAEFANDEAERVLAYEAVYGAEFVKERADKFAAAGDKGRGLIIHVLASLGYGNKERDETKTDSYHGGATEL